MAMKKNRLTLIIAINLAVLALLVFALPQLMVSPGRPIEAHADLADNCFACHTPFIGSTAEKCITCHRVEEIGKLTTTGVPIERENKQVAFHQQLIEEDCVACHSEHKGVKPFRPIGRFSHDLLQVATREQCDGCHSKPGDALHQKIDANCSECHSNEAWLPATFDHRDYFRFDRHHDTECSTCHVDSNYATYTCYGCHEHSRSKIREEHLEEGIYEYENCTECHRSGDEDEAERIWKQRRFETRGKQRPALKQQMIRRYRDHDDDDD
jgi:hypothetical protein